MTIVDLRRKFLPKFVKSARGRLSRGREHLAQGRPAALARELHALIGEAAILGFHPLSDAARKAEDAARAGRDVLPLLDEIDRQLAKVAPSE